MLDLNNVYFNVYQKCGICVLFLGYVRVSVEGQGFVDKKRGRTLYGRSRAIIKVNGRDYSPHRRGFDVVVLNRRTGKHYSS